MEAEILDRDLRTKACQTLREKSVQLGNNYRECWSAEECEMVKKILDTQPHQWLTVLRVLILKKNQPELWTSFNYLGS